MIDRYAPPYRIVPGILHSIEQIGEALGNLRVGSASAVVPVLRRGNRIKTIQASLAIEGNSLSFEQVTAVLAGKRGLAQPREIQEVRNAFAAYEKLTEWTAQSRADLLRSDSSDLVMAMIHKFRETDLTEMFPELNASPHILVMTDEAHRSQYAMLGVSMSLFTAKSRRHDPSACIKNCEGAATITEGKAPGAAWRFSGRR